MSEKVVRFEDENTNLVALTRGMYLIDGNVINVDTYGKKLISVKNIDDIRYVSNKTVISYYMAGTDRMEVDEYEQEVAKLKSKRTTDEYGEYMWDSLEDEFSYRKFMTIWKSINTKIQTISDPILVEVETTKYNTGNKFISNDFLNEKGEIGLFVYKRQEALLDIVENCFKDLGMEFHEGVNYSSTSNKKVWSNSTHSGIRYVVAFGTYIFNDSWNCKGSRKGTLKDCEKMYEDDKKSIESIIQKMYNKHFGKIDKDEFNFEGLLALLKVIDRQVTDLPVNKKCVDGKYSTLSKITKAINMITDSYKEQDDQQ